MANYITDFAGNALTGFLAKANANAEIRTIETQMLDGSFTVQTIGNSATRIAVEFVCSRSTRRLLEDCTFSGEPIKVFWQDRIWTGLIAGGAIKWEVWSYTHSVYQEKLDFELLVLEEAER